jgi:hypothetical protein
MSLENLARIGKLKQHSGTSKDAAKPGDFEVTIPGWKWALGWPVLVDPSRTGTPQSCGDGGGVARSYPRCDLSRSLQVNLAFSG